MVCSIESVAGAHEHEYKKLCLVVVSAKSKINYIYLTNTVSLKIRTKPCSEFFPNISLGRLVAASAPGPAAAAARVVGVFASASVEEEGRLAGASVAASPSPGHKLCL